MASPEIMANRALYRQSYAELGPLAYFTFDGNSAAQGFDDSLRGRKTEAGSGCLRRKEGLENALQSFDGHALACVDDIETHGRPFSRDRLERDLAAVGHRLLRVQEKIEQGLAKHLFME